jgi:hypothetical protein
MSKKTIRATKREQRRIWNEYLEGITGYLRPKPKYMPWAVWEWMQKKVLRMDKINKRV